MLKCPECDYLAVEFDSYFHRPRCYSCGWLPADFKVYTANLLFEPCPECFGYTELRLLSGQYCPRCKSHGKILTHIGQEFMDIIQESIMDELSDES